MSEYKFDSDYSSWSIVFLATLINDFIDMISFNMFKRLNHITSVF